MKFDPSKLPEGFEEEWRKRRAFSKAIHEIFGYEGVSSGSRKDQFGGMLYHVYIYSPDAKDKQIDRNVERQFGKHKELVNELLPKIKEGRHRSVSKKLSQALQDLDIEVLAPLYEATGKKYKAQVIHYNPASDEEIEKLEKEELVQGIIKRTTLKQFGPGRPHGSTKPAEKKAQEAAKFEKKVEKTIRTLLSTKGEIPTKTAVAKALGIGGLNPDTGIDSSLTAFGSKLKRLEVDYKAIVERVRLNK